MTHPLPKDSCNVTVNLRVGERRFLGRFATDHNQTLSDFVRGAIHLRVKTESPDAARKLLTIRGEPEDRRQLLLRCVAIALLITLAGLLLLVSADANRPPTIVGDLVPIDRGGSAYGEDGR